MNPPVSGQSPRSRLAAFVLRYGDVFWWLHSLWALLIGAGVWSATQLPIDAVPDITNQQVVVNAAAPARERAKRRLFFMNHGCSGLSVAKALTGFLQSKSAEGLAPAGYATGVS